MTMIFKCQDDGPAFLSDTEHLSNISTPKVPDS